MQKSQVDELWRMDTFAEVAQVVVVWRKVLEPVEREVQMLVARVAAQLLVEAQFETS